MDAVTLFTPAVIPPLTVTPSQLAVTASDSVSTRQTPAAVPAPVSGDAVNTQTNRSAATYIPPAVTSSANAQDSVQYIAQSVSQEDNIPGVVGIATQSAEFTPAVQYDQLVADSFIKYKPSYAGLPQNALFAASAVSAYQSGETTPAIPQVSVEG